MLPAGDEATAIFGFGHLYQGLGTALSMAVSSALEPVAAHASSDVLAMRGATPLSR